MTPNAATLIHDLFTESDHYFVLLALGKGVLVNEGRSGRLRCVDARGERFN